MIANTNTYPVSNIKNGMRSYKMYIVILMRYLVAVNKLKNVNAPLNSPQTRAGMNKKYIFLYEQK